MPQDNFDEFMEKHRPSLSNTEVVALWNASAKRLPKKVVVSPYLAWIRVHHMAPVAIVLVILLGTGTTVAASNLAKPGDLLFPIERAVERTQLALVSDERAAELRTAFAKERLAELEAIITEEAEDTVSEDGTEVSTVLVSESGEVRISRAVNEMLDVVEEVRDEDRDEYIKTLLSRIDKVAVHGREKGRVRSDDQRFEVRDEDSRVRIDDERVEVRENGYRIRLDTDGDKKTKKEEKNRGDKERDTPGYGVWDSSDYAGELEDEDEDIVEDEDSRDEEERYEDDGRRRGHDEEDVERGDEDDESDDADDRSGRDDGKGGKDDDGSAEDSN